MIQVLDRLRQIFQADSGEEPVYDTVGRIILMRALTVGDLDSSGQFWFILPGDQMTGPYIVMMGDVAVIIVFLNRSLSSR